MIWEYVNHAQQPPVPPPVKPVAPIVSDAVPPLQHARQLTVATRAVFNDDYYCYELDSKNWKKYIHGIEALET